MQERKLLLAVCTRIEVKARLLRGSVFFTGECMECEIIFSNAARVGEKTNSGTCNHALNNECTTEKCETDRLAWASTMSFMRFLILL